MKRVAVFALPLAVVLLAALLYYPPLVGESPNPAGTGAYYFEAMPSDLVNINTAPAEELCALPGIGEVKAAAIIAYREAHGPFTDTEQLLHVQGIGPATWEALQDKICL